MEIFPLSHKDDDTIALWNFGKGFILTIYPYIFHTELVRKKCSEELELEFLETEDPTRRGGPRSLELSEILCCLIMSQ